MVWLSNTQLRLITLSSAVLLAALMTLCIGSTLETSSHTRHKRHILQMCELIAVHTNRRCFDYNNYGCFCGLGNADSRPVDAVDKCCRSHDRCYGSIDCFWLYPQFVGYSYECDHNECTCSDSPLLSSCAYTTCQCDLKFAQCLRRSEFKHHFSNYNRQECKPASGRKRRDKMAKKKLKKERNVKKKHKRRPRKGVLVL